MKRPSELEVGVPTGAVTTALVYSAGDHGIAAFVLAHGAGAGQRSPFIVEYARALSGLGLDVVTFNFLYTEQGRRVPDRGPLLEACYRALADAVLDQLQKPLFIGGKSMGGRIATQIAATDPRPEIVGLVLLGYPLHPPGQADKRRDAHLRLIQRPTLFVQGSRDAFGTPEELAPSLANMLPPPTVHVVAGGDHSFKLPPKDRAAQPAVHEDVQRAIVEWIRSTISERRRADAR